MTQGLMQKNQANNREALYEVQIYTTLFNKKILGYKFLICVLVCGGSIKIIWVPLSVGSIIKGPRQNFQSGVPPRQIIKAFQIQGDYIKEFFLLENVDGSRLLKE